MAKKSGSRSSRSERNAGRKRAERARQHGLPVRREPAPRQRAVTPEPSDDSYGEARSSDAPLSNAKKSAGIPTLVKVVGGALVILIGVYFLSRQRDEALLETKPAAEPAAALSASVSSAGQVGPELVPAPEASPPVEPTPAAASPVAAAPVVSVTPPAKPVAAEPVVLEPSKPKVAKPVPATPVAPKPVATPAAVAPVAAPAVPAPAAAPVAPKAAPAPAAPVDNPY